MPKPIARWNPARDVWETETTGLFCEHSDVYSETWPSSGTTRAGTAYELPMLEPRTDDSECSSLLQTPSVSDATGGHTTRGGERSGELLLPGQALSLLPTPEAKLASSGPDYARAARAASGGDDLATSMARLLPTPTARDHKGANQRQDDTCLTGALLPTPRATDGTKGGPNQRGSSGDLMLPSAVQLLPTPTTTQRGTDANRDTREGAGPNLHNAVAALLPTPTATPYGNNQSPSPGAAVRPSLDSLFSGASTNPRFAAGKPSSDDPHPHLRSPDPEADSG